MGLCGACTVKINGRPRLACATKLVDLGTDTIVVEPVADRVVKDLVVDG
jgi:succinate dehydrogenase subunit B (EC 1.3.5.1)